MARIIASKAPLAVSVVKEQLRILADSDPVTPDVLERIQELRDTIDLVVMSAIRKREQFMQEDIEPSRPPLADGHVLLRSWLTAPPRSALLPCA
jgi:phosphate uptake regulator